MIIILDHNMFIVQAADNGLLGRCWDNLFCLKMDGSPMLPRILEIHIT
jgi:hypothetical protein